MSITDYPDHPAATIDLPVLVSHWGVDLPGKTTTEPFIVDRAEFVIVRLDATGETFGCSIDGLTYL